MTDETVIRLRNRIEELEKTLESVRTLILKVEGFDFYDPVALVQRWPRGKTDVMKNRGS
jgi:hypothetical protein